MQRYFSKGAKFEPELGHKSARPQHILSRTGRIRADLKRPIGYPRENIVARKSIERIISRFLKEKQRKIKIILCDQKLC